MTQALPTVFLSHGSPMHAIAPGAVREAWQSLAADLPRPKALLMVSAHWETHLPMLTGQAKPETIHDFYGFPRPLYQVQYPAPGAPQVAERALQLIELGIKADKPCDDFVFGIAMFNTEGTCVYGTNTDIEKYQAQSLTGEATVTFDIEAIDLVEGTYKLDVAVHKKDGAPYDYHRLLYTFRVKSRTKDAGIYRPRHHWKFSPTAQLTRLDTE